MPSFRTSVNIPDFPFKITHNSPVLNLGSCFAEHIGNRLERYKFSSFLNSHGIIYNPISIARTIEDLLSQKRYEEEDLLEYGGQWHSFNHHGHFSHPELAQALEKINGRFSEARAFLEKLDVLILTFGTANAFVWNRTGDIVANCHKIPGQEFQRIRLSVAEITEIIGGQLSALRQMRPELKVLLTVSPVRHIRDGLVENQRSKATLLLAVEQLEKQLDFVHYFPSYELVLDDLRDYRFYDRDMIHPSTVAVDYVWEQFENSFFSKETQALTKRIDRILSASQHRPFHAESAAHQTFIKKQLHDIAVLKKEFPTLDFSREIAIFGSQKL